MTIDVEVLSIAGCEATPTTIALVREVAADLDLAIALAHTVIATPEEATERGFIGSPSVRVAGQDIEAAARKVSFFGMT